MRKPYIIGETAYNHEGSFDYLLRMTEDIAACQLDAVKYHLLFNLDSYYQKDHPLLGEASKWVFSEEQWSQLFQRAITLGLEIVALCDDVDSLAFICRQFPSIFAIEIHATSINDVMMLREAAGFPGKVILGVGGSSVDEVEYALGILYANEKPDVLLMHGFQAYPTNYADINLAKMAKLRDLFGLPVGYADHTAYDDPNNEIVTALGFALGADVIEKHFTPDYGVERIDYHAAVGAEQMRRISELTALFAKAIGNGRLELTAAEKKYGNTGPMKKAIVARQPIAKGETITIDNVCFKRTVEESTVRQKDLENLLGQKAARNIDRDEIIDFSKVAYSFGPMSLDSFTNLSRD